MFLMKARSLWLKPKVSILNIHPVTAGKELWAVVSSALALARQNPTPFVSAVRIVEREEALDRALLEERGGTRGNTRPLPPGRPRCWRACFFQVSTSCYKHTNYKLFTFYQVSAFWIYHCVLQSVLSHISFLSGTRGGGFCTFSQCFLPAYARTRSGRPPLCSPARYHGWPGHRTPPAGALCPTTLPADRSLPEGQPPLFTCSPGTGRWCERNEPMLQHV